jgi:hypothetical protein
LLIHPVLAFDPEGARWPIVPDALVYSARSGGFRPIEIKSIPYLGGRGSVEGVRIALLQLSAAALALEELERSLGIKRPQKGSFRRGTLVLADPKRPWQPEPLWDVAFGAERDHLKSAVIPALREGLARARRGATPEHLDKLPARFSRECHSCPAYRACREEAKQCDDLSLLGNVAAEKLAALKNRSQVTQAARALSQGAEPSRDEERRLLRALRVVGSIRAGVGPVKAIESEEGSVAEEVEALLRLDAAQRDRAVLTRGVQETPLSRAPYAFSLLLCPFENRLWGYALTPSGEVPAPVLSPDPRGPEAEQSLLRQLEDDLGRVLSGPGDPFVQLVVPSRAEVEALALVSSRTAPFSFPRLKAILDFLLDQAEQEMSAGVVIATLLLHRQLRTGQPPQDDLHLGVSLAWAEAYFEGGGAREEALDAERLPIGPRLSPEDEDAAALLFRAPEWQRARYEPRTRAILSAHLTRSIAQAQQAVEVVRRLSLPCPAHHVKLAEAAKEATRRLVDRFGQARLGVFASEVSPYTAASRYLERVAVKHNLDFWTREGDERAALEAEDAGLAEPARVLSLDRHRALLVFSCRRRTSRLREGDRVAVRGYQGRLAGTLRAVVTPPGEARQLMVEITEGHRIAYSLEVGQEVLLHPTSLAAIAIRKKILLRDSKRHLPWLFDPRQEMPRARPRPNTPMRQDSLEIPLQPALQAMKLSAPPRVAEEPEPEARPTRKAGHAGR